MGCADRRMLLLLLHLQEVLLLPSPVAAPTHAPQPTAHNTTQTHLRQVQVLGLAHNDAGARLAGGRLERRRQRGRLGGAVCGEAGGEGRGGQVHICIKKGMDGS